LRFEPTEQETSSAVGSTEPSRVGLLLDAYCGHAGVVAASGWKQQRVALGRAFRREAAGSRSNQQ